MNRRKWTVGGVAVAAMLAVGGVAYATISDSGGVIHGCYARSGGSLRVIDDGVTNCKSTETALAWNVQGVQGPAGPQGATGPLRPEPRLPGHLEGPGGGPVPGRLGRGLHQQCPRRVVPGAGPGQGGR